MTAHNLKSNIKTSRVMPGHLGGISTLTSESVDTANFQGVQFIALFGAVPVGGTPEIKLQASDDNATWADVADVAQSLDNDDDHEIVLIDVYKPTSRYLRLELTRGGGNTIFDGALALQYGPRVLPITEDADVKASLLVVGS